MNKPPKVLVLIPCYNEQDNIVQVVERLRATCPWADYLVINDCSTDRSAELLRSHGYNFIDLPVNLGQSAAASSAGISTRSDMATT